jgi:hypothetical protein
MVCRDFGGRDSHDESLSRILRGQLVDEARKILIEAGIPGHGMVLEKPGREATCPDQDDRAEDGIAFGAENQLAGACRFHLRLDRDSLNVRIQAIL